VITSVAAAGAMPCRARPSHSLYLPNDGSFTITGNTAVTDASGIAIFPNLKISKPGGYTMTAVSELGGSVSTFFNIDGH